MFLSDASVRRPVAMGCLIIGLTLLISFSYYGILRIGQSLGHSGVLEPFVSAWMGNIVFIAVGGVLLYRANQ